MIMAKSLGEDVCMCDCPQNVLSTLCDNKLEPSPELQNMYTSLCRQFSDPLIGRLSDLETLNKNDVFCETTLDNFGKIPKLKLKPVFNNTVPKSLDEGMCRINSEEINTRLQKVLSLSNEICSGSDKTIINKQHNQESDRRNSRKCSLVKKPESQNSLNSGRTSTNEKTLQETVCSQKCSKGVPTEKSSTIIISEQKKCLKNPELSNGVRNNVKQFKHVVKKKRKTNKKKQHKTYNFKISDYTKNIYPGFCIGHRHCVDSAVKVPKNMGWLWNITDEVTGYKPHPTWRPGAIPKSISKIIKDTISKLCTEIREPFATQSKKKIRGQGSSAHAHDSGSEIISGPTPLLHLHETKDTYCVNMCPLHKDYQNQKNPINFKIRKCNDNEDSSFSDSSLEIDVIVPNEPSVKPEQAKEKSNEHLNEEEIKAQTDIPTQKNVPEKKKKGAGKQGSKQSTKK